MAEAQDKEKFRKRISPRLARLNFWGEKRRITIWRVQDVWKFKAKDFERMKYLAKTFSRRRISISTLRKSLSPQEIKGIASIAKQGRRYWKPERPINPVMILTGTELLSDFGPPYCWEDSQKKKFDRVAGLLDICDTTQQIYLNLPSWHKDWDEKWEKKYQRRMANKRKRENPTPS